LPPFREGLRLREATLSVSLLRFGIWLQQTRRANCGHPYRASAASVFSRLGDGEPVPPNLPGERDRDTAIRGAHQQGDCRADADKRQYRQGLLARDHGQDGRFQPLRHLGEGSPTLNPGSAPQAHLRANCICRFAPRPWLPCGDRISPSRGVWRPLYRTTFGGVKAAAKSWGFCVPPVHGLGELSPPNRLILLG